MGPEVPLFTLTAQRFFPIGTGSTETVTARIGPPLLPASLVLNVTLVMWSRPTLTLRWVELKDCAEAGSLLTAPAPEEGGAAPEGRGPTHR
jgi:hypothetical protein